MYGGLYIFYFKDYVPRLLAAMDSHADHAGVLENSCMALANVANNGAAVSLAIVLHVLSLFRAGTPAAAAVSRNTMASDTATPLLARLASACYARILRNSGVVSVRIHGRQ